MKCISFIVFLGSFVSCFAGGVLREQYPPLKSTAFQVEVAKGHMIHVEESGNPNGVPVVFFHGGPGITFRQTDHQWFNPEKYCIIVFQQRGTHRCAPSAMDLSVPSQIFQDVTIDTLVEDIEVLREHLGIEKWLVFGGSWGSTLSVFYAQEHPERCIGLVLRGIFLATHKENAMFFDEARHKEQCGSSWRHEAIERVISYAKAKGVKISLDEPDTIYSAYSKLCVDQNDPIAQHIWVAFEDFVDDATEDSFNRLMSDEGEIDPLDRSIGIWETLLMDSVAQSYDLLSKDRLAKMSGIPVHIVQGGSDNLCHPSIAKELANGLRAFGCEVNYSLVEGGCHSPYSPGMTDALIRATDSFLDK